MNASERIDELIAGVTDWRGKRYDREVLCLPTMKHRQNHSRISQELNATFTTPVSPRRSLYVLQSL